MDELRRYRHCNSSNNFRWVTAGKVLLISESAMIRAPTSLIVVRSIQVLLHLDRPQHVHCTCNHTALIPMKGQAPKTMTKKPFTTRFDPDVLAIAQRLAKTERRSITAIIELALIEYAERHPNSNPGEDHEKNPARE